MCCLPLLRMHSLTHFQTNNCKTRTIRVLFNYTFHEHLQCENFTEVSDRKYNFVVQIKLRLENTVTWWALKKLILKFKVIK